MVYRDGQACPHSTSYDGGLRKDIFHKELDYRLSEKKIAPFKKKIILVPAMGDNYSRSRDGR